ncbi:MAG: hypothetical protein ACOC2B_02850 [Sediminispirochaetaceae bacterium]
MSYLKNYFKQAFITGAAVLAVFTVIGCAGVPEDVEEAPEPAPAEKPEEKQEFKEVQETVQVVARESAYYPDGVLDEYRVFTYKDSSAEVQKEELFSSSDELQEKIEYTYEEEWCTEKTAYGEDGEKRRTHVYSYDEQGNLVEDALYDSDDNLQSVSRYEYNKNGERTKWSIFDIGDSLLAYTEYTYEDGKNTGIENFSPNGNMEDYFILEYDGEGRLEKETWYDSSGKVEEYTTFEYEDGAPVMEVVHRGNDSIKRKIRYNNNSHGNPESVVYMDGGDNVQERVAFEYTERTKTRRVAVDQD